MRRYGIFSLCLIVLTFLSAANSFAQTSTEYLQSRIIAGFDNAQELDFRGDSFGWTVRINGGGTQDPEPVFQRVQTFPRALYNRNNPAPDNAQAFGVRAGFVRQGYNYLEFIPVYGSDPTKGIPIPGIAKTMDFWVWGSNYNYYLEAHLRDYRGVSHVIRMGDTNFRGWNNLQARIPSIIPQQDYNDPLGKRLQITKIVLWTTPGEKVNDFYIYIDEIKVFTDMFAQPYDGDELADPDNVNTLWGGTQ